MSADHNSCLYVGRIRHRRHAPRRNDFRYRIYLNCIDLDELDRLFAKGQPVFRPAFGFDLSPKPGTTAGGVTLDDITAVPNANGQDAAFEKTLFELLREACPDLEIAVMRAAPLYTAPEHPLLSELRQPKTLQRAMVASLILAPPRALANRR